ncbi:hypothetical protein V5O48_016935 [Marasmius crinis-equi]|uniref:Helicase ATP-binding domain-containing protein n=1 Tax=Marasmius crinis-equi TaxID=585013 RepID=A0ABR3EQC7_9AGAR
MPSDSETSEFFSDNEPDPSTSESFNTTVSNPQIDACDRVLREVFGHSSYKGKQKEIIEAAVLGYDVFVLAPTGMGKASERAQSRSMKILKFSLESMFPSASSGCRKLQSLRQKGVPVVSLTSETPQYERQEITQDLQSGDPEYRLLYVTPEKMGTGDFLRQLRAVYNNQQLNRLVVDEAHCISEWGHDFRGDYRKLGLFRERFPGVPIMALTATATTSQVFPLSTARQRSYQFTLAFKATSFAR